MLVGVIHKKTLSAIADCAGRIDSNVYDLLELRLDGCTDLTPEKLAAIRFPLPVIYTLRTASEGGAFAGNEEDRLDMLEQLAALHPAYMDVEACVPAERIARIQAASPATRLILSSHDFSKTDDLNAILTRMRKKADGVIYKIAAMAQNTPDALRMLLFCKQASAQGIPIIGISMGEFGECTRILAPVYHTGFCYCPVEESTAPGQLPAKFLRETYNFSTLTPSTAVYGLLGNPVAQSVGHHFHNAKNKEAGINAVYVKWRVTPDEVPETMRLLAALHVRGASVTMPLKETIVPCLTRIDQCGNAIGAINTLVLEHDGYSGTNTDGKGAFDIIPVPVKGLRIAVIGAGGTARSVVWEAIERGAAVRVYNRSPGKKLPGGITALPLTRLTELQSIPCDIIINTLPFVAGFDYSAIPFTSSMLAYDVSYAPGSHFLACATAADCATLDGNGMFEAQAMRQRKFWGMLRQ